VSPTPVQIAFHSLFAKKMMATADTLLKSKAVQQPAQIIEADRCIRGSAQDPPKSLFRTHAISVAGDRSSSISLMPENLENSLSKQQLADVIAYLRAGL